MVYKKKTIFFIHIFFVCFYFLAQNISSAQASDRWSGPYIGIAYAYDNPKLSWSYFGDLFKGSPKMSVFTGYNVQKSLLLYGMEAELLYNKSKSSLISLPHDWQMQLSLRGRGGIALSSFLLYVAPGLALNHLDATHKSTSLDYSLALGLDTMIMPDIFLRVEKRYNNFIIKSKKISSLREELHIGLALKF